MPVRFRDTEIAEIIERMKVYRKRRIPLMEATQRVADDMGVPQTAVYSVVRRMRPTAEVATEYIRANSLKMAMRVVRKANVEQTIQVLSRPNIGVLDPPGDGGGGGGRQFIVGVAVDSLGSVKVGVQLGPAAPKSLGPADTSREDSPLGEPPVDVTEDEEGVEADGEDGEDGEDEDARPLPTAKRRWYRPDPKPRTEGLEPAPVQEGRIVGQSLEMRLAIAKAERKQKAREREKEREAVSRRARELKEQLARARGE